MKVLFVCQGNVARSQMAEAYYNFFTKTKDAFSAGVSKNAPEKYMHPVKEVVEAMNEDGIDVSRNKVKTLTKEMVAFADKIFVLCERELCPAFLADSQKVTFWEVEDPYNTPLEDFIKTRDLIKSKVYPLCHRT